MTHRHASTDIVAVFWALAIWIALALVVSCANGDDDDDDNDDGNRFEVSPSDNTSNGNDDPSDDVWDDWWGCQQMAPSGDGDYDTLCGDWDDWTDDDDSEIGAGPVLTGGTWTPFLLSDNASSAYVISLGFAVCDEQGDLAGGLILVWYSDSWMHALEGDLPWENFMDGASVLTDCTNPAPVEIAVDFAPLVPFGGDVCVDVEGSDGAGNLSNKLTNICVFVP